MVDIDPVCKDCQFYRRQKGDEVARLADAFHNMIWGIRLYRRRLRESEKKYRSLFDSGPDPIFVINHQSFDIIDANPRAVEVYGYRREELIGRPSWSWGLKTRMSTFIPPGPGGNARAGHLPQGAALQERPQAFLRQPACFQHRL